MFEFVDEVSGLRYKKTTTPVVTQALEQLETVEIVSSVPENVDTDSVFSDFSASTIKTVVAFNNSRPRVCTAEWLQCMPSKWNDSYKLRQFIIWAAESMMEELSRMGLKKNPIAEKVLDRLIKTLKTSPHIVSLYKHPAEKSALVNMFGYIQPKRNSVNVENERILREYQEGIAAIKDEIKQWEKCESEIFDKHAITADKLHALSRTDEQKLNQSSFFTAELDPEIEIILNHNVNITRTQELLSNLPFEIALFKQKMHTASEFNHRAHELAVDVKHKLAYIERENSIVMPEEKNSALFMNHRLMRKEKEATIIEHLLRLYTQIAASKASKL